MPDSVNIRKLTPVLALKALQTSEVGRRQSSSCVLCAVYMEVASDNSALGILMGRVVAEEAVPIWSCVALAGSAAQYGSAGSTGLPCLPGAAVCSVAEEWKGNTGKHEAWGCILTR